MAVFAATSAVFAAVVAVSSGITPERVWGTFAACGYGVATVVALLARHRRAETAAVIGVGGALLAPLAWMSTVGTAAPEVPVIVHSAQLLLRRGVPYHSTATLAAAHSPYIYDPYLPLITGFGLPRALAGGGGGFFTDPRLWFAVTFAVAFGCALAVSGVARPWWWTLAATASPVAALPLSIGGDDLPMVGLMCLGLALLGRAAGRRPQPAAAGVVFGLATAMKATALPALAVALLLVATRHGWRATAKFAVAAFGIPAVVVGGTMSIQPHAVVANTILFPLGLARIKSPAASVLPGYLLASTGSAGHWAALALLAAAGTAVGLWLLMRPPRDERAAGWRLALGLTLMIMLAPATRVGYVVYPLMLTTWLLLSCGTNGRLARRVNRWLAASAGPPASRAAPRPDGMSDAGMARVTRGAGS